MFFYKFFLINIFILFILKSYVSACHQGDFESTAKGHHQWGKKVGFFQFTENTTITSVTSTSCDYYTAFLESQYNYIQEQVVIGSGQHIEALTMMSGCDSDSKYELIRTLRNNYSELFLVKNDPKILGQKIKNLIYSNPLMEFACQKA